MNEPGEKNEFPLYINRKASTFVFRKNGKFFIKMKEGGEMMSNAEEKDTTVIPPERSKTDAAEGASMPQNTGGSEQISKIRDLIFGNEMQDYEKRFGRLEERMFKEMTASKSESRKNFDSLEKNINKELETLKDRVMSEQGDRSESFTNIERQLEDINRSLKDQVKAERDARAESVTNVERQLKDATRSFEKRLDKLDDLLNSNTRELRQQMTEGSQGLRNDIRQKYEETASAIERVALELRTNKVDRSALADFFTEMAMRVTNDRT